MVHCDNLAASDGDDRLGFEGILLDGDLGLFQTAYLVADSELSQYQIDATGSSPLECRGLTRHRPYVNHRCSNRLSERDEAIYGARCRATANESGVKPPHSKVTQRVKLTDRCLPNS